MSWVFIVSSPLVRLMGLEPALLRSFVCSFGWNSVLCSPEDKNKAWQRVSICTHSSSASRLLFPSSVDCLYRWLCKKAGEAKSSQSVLWNLHRFRIHLVHLCMYVYRRAIVHHRRVGSNRRLKYWNSMPVSGFRVLLETRRECWRQKVFVLAQKNKVQCLMGKFIATTAGADLIVMA